MANRRSPPDRTPRPLDAARLDELALAYVARFATSRAKLARYLARKVRESAWDADSDAAAACAAAVEKMERLGFVDDRQYAVMRGAAMTRRGLGVRRVQAQMWADGIAPADSGDAVAAAVDAGMAAAMGFARRRRLGPFAAALVTDPALRQRQIAAFARAGHSLELARRILGTAPGQEATLDDAGGVD